MAYRKRGVKASPQLPTDRTSVRGSKEKYFCPICDEVIVDAESNKAGDDSIHCEGSCATWLQCRCAGLSQVAFNCIVFANQVTPSTTQNAD